MDHQENTCSVAGCENRTSKRGLCNKHYLKLIRYGDPLGGHWSWGEPRPRRHDGSACSIDGCEREAKLGGMCKLHWSRLYKTGEVGPAGLKVRGLGIEHCSVDGCDRLGPFTKGLCKLHEHRLRRTGDPGPVDLKIAPKGTGTMKNGYRMIGERPEHRTVMERHIGRPLLKHENVHHINGQRADNRIENLELWSTSQPYGQRVIDKIAWARDILALYEGIEPQLRLF